MGACQNNRQSAKMERMTKRPEIGGGRCENTESNMMRSLRKMQLSYRMQVPNL